MKQYNPLISIIITNYNYGSYISDAINSVFSQTYPNIELIIINDGSTDDSDGVIKKLIINKPIKHIRYVNRENRGVVYSRNEGKRLAKGDFICYLDADDYFNNDYIEKSYEIAEKNSADVVYPNWHFVGEWLGHPDTDFPEFTSKLLQLQKLHVTPASLMRLSAIKGYDFEAEKVAEDWDFFINLSLNGAKFKLAKDNFINYRIRQGTRGSRNSPEEDTEYFMEILNKYRKTYGEKKVIDPKKLYKLRHPNLLMKIMNNSYITRLKLSVKKNGLGPTMKKIITKIVTNIKPLWSIVKLFRNLKYKYSKIGIKTNSSKNTKLAVVVHLYYVDLWPTISDRLANIDVPFDLYVSLRKADKDTTLDKISQYHMTTNYLPLPNRGRDVLPFLTCLSYISKKSQYKYILKLHSKKSLHRKDGSEWLEELLEQLIPKDINNIIRTLEKTETGAVGPRDHIVSLSKYMGNNKHKIAMIIDSITGEDEISADIIKNADLYPFFGGTMFWCRVDYMSTLLKSKELTPADFHTEKGQVDGTTAHAFERVVGMALHEVLNKKMYIIDKKSNTKQIEKKSFTEDYKHVN